MIVLLFDMDQSTLNQSDLWESHPFIFYFFYFFQV